MKAFEARVFQDATRWDRNAVRLLIRDGERRAFLMQDGTWKSFDEGTLIGDEAGIELPAQAIEAIAVAIQEFQGHTSHADTEARILREWLAAEQRRVDQLLPATSTEQRESPE